MATKGAWVTGWATPITAAGPVPRPYPNGFADQTVRQVVRVSAGGEALRVTFAHPFGLEPVTFTSVTLALADQRAALRPGTLRSLTFGSEEALTLPPRGEVRSDPVSLELATGELLAVTFHCAELGGPPALGVRGATPYVADGDRLRDEHGDAFRSLGPATAFTGPGAGYFLAAIDVLAGPAERGTIVVLGDSIAAGGWPEHLAQAILPAAGIALAVVNAGIPGNRVLTSSPIFGESARQRFDRDVLAHSGTRAVFFSAGINDIGFPHLAEAATGSPRLGDCRPIALEELIAGHEEVVARVHAAGLPVFGGTLLPCRGAIYWCDEAEAMRRQFNEWLRSVSPYDAVVDFEAALADPADPLQLLPAFDSGDHLHPNAAGQERLAHSVDLELLRTLGPASRRTMEP